MNENGSEINVECSTCVQLLVNAGMKEYLKTLELDTFRHDLIFCCTTAEPEQGDQLE